LRIDIAAYSQNLEAKIEIDKTKENKKGEGCICLHLFTTGNITRHSLAVGNCVCLIVQDKKNWR
jgi:hypothetical protein